MSDCAAFTASFTSAAVTFFSNSTTKSTTEPVMTGTRNAIPSNLPFNCGNTKPTAFAAPVDVGTVLAAAALPLLALIPFGWGMSRVAWSFV